MGYSPAIFAMLAGQFPSSPGKIVSLPTLLSNLAIGVGQIPAHLIVPTSPFLLVVFAVAMYLAGLVALFLPAGSARARLGMEAAPPFVAPMAAFNVALTFCTVSLVGGSDNRYLQPFYLALTAGMAVAADALWRRQAWVSALALTLFCGYNARALARQTGLEARPVAAEQLARALAERGFQGGYADYWTAYATTAAGAERVTLAPTTGNNRYRPYRDFVKSLRRIAWVDAVPSDRKTLTIEGVTYQVEGIAVAAGRYIHELVAVPAIEPGSATALP
jgi:hypothetical protein